MRKLNAKFNTAFLSEAGSFLHNKDYFAFAEMDDFAIYVIADGIDDDVELDSAQIAVASIIRQFSEKPSMKKRHIKNWLKEANKELLALSKTMRLKASIMVVITDYVNLIYGLAGNTRLLHYRQGALIHQSSDHSLGKELLEEGEISKDKLDTHLERHNLYCYLGQPDGFNPEVSGLIKLADGDTVVLLTRGIWENIDDGELTDAVKDAKEPQEALDNAEDVLLSRQPPNLDNYTIAAIFIDKIYQDSGARKARIRRIVSMAIPVLLIIFIALGFACYRHIRQKEQLTAMSRHIATGKALYEENNYARAGEEYKAAQDIAKRLKLKNEQKSLENYCKTIGLIVAADAALQQKDFIKATETYQAALDASYYADQLGHSYISKQQRLTDNYMKVTELLQTGDQKAELKDLAGAHQAYTEAKVIASRIYYAEGRKEATDKLATIGLQMTEESKKTTEQEATGYEMQGDRLAQMEDYEGAIEMWNIACDMYAQAGKSDRSAIVQTKIANITDRKNAAERFEQQRQAMELEREGDRKFSKKQFEEARYDFVLAQEAYGAAGLSNNVALIQKKIDAVDKKLKR